jgi:hypothetical protein
VDLALLMCALADVCTPPRGRYWMVGLDSVQIAGKAVPNLSADGAIMDTGTSLITTSAVDAAAINSVRGSQGLLDFESGLQCTQCAWALFGGSVQLHTPGWQPSGWKGPICQTSAAVPRLRPGASSAQSPSWASRGGIVSPAGFCFCF